ncbi:MAG: FemAB family PEP-CTERM system-associated protein [Desulfobacteraceae bacterium]|nr:FemAB family PEP-CTERM system-associated protein [Desulfobacteraceae bacterium]
MMEFEIKQLKPKNEKKWDEFVMENDDTTFYHQIGWKKVIQESYDHKPYYLFAGEDAGDIVGILPLFYMTNLFFGKRLISLPFVPYGGVCAADGLVEKALIDKAIDIGNKLGVDYCEFRNFKVNNTHENINCIKNHSTFHLDVSEGYGHVWNNINRNVRNRIRKGMKCNLKYEMDSSFNAISEFYEIYSRSMKRLGTPVHDHEFFKNILKQFPDNVFISRANVDDLQVSAFYILTFKDVLITAWGASLFNFFKYTPNHFIYWNCIKYASENNLLWVDFGRSLVNSGNYVFKSRCGCAEVSLNYCYYPPSKVLSPPQNEYGKFAKVWSRMPLLLANKIGPMVRKNVP